MSQNAGRGGVKPRVAGSASAQTYKTNAETLPESAEMEQIFASNSLATILRSVEEHFFEVVFLLLNQKAKPKVDMIGALVGLSADAWFSFLMCFSTAITWPDFLRPFQLMADAFLLKTSALSEKAIYGVFSFFFCYFYITISVIGVAAYMAKRQIVPHPSIQLFMRVSIFGMIHIFYYPMLSSLMGIMNCVETEDGYTIDGNSRIECFKGSHMTLFFFSLATCILFFIFAYASSLVYFDAAPKSRKYLSRPISRQECFILFAKTILILSITFSRSSAVQSTILFLLNLASLVLWIYYPMYHRSRANQLRSLLFGINTWTALICLVCSNQSDPNNIGPFAAYMVGLPLAAYAGWHFAGKRVMVLNEEHMENRNRASKEQKIFSNAFMVELATRTPLNPLKGEVTPAVLENTKYIYQQGVKKFPDSIYVRINFTLFLLCYNTYTDPSEIQMHLHAVLGMRKRAIDERYLAFYLRKLWQQDMDAKGLGFMNDGMQITDFMFLKRQMILSKHLHAETRKCMLEFWRNLLKQGITESQIESKAEDFEALEQMALGCYEGILRKFPRNREVLRGFGQFWIDIYGNEAVANEYFQLADEIEEEESQKHARAKFEGQAANPSVINESGTESDTSGRDEQATSIRRRKGDHEAGSVFTTSSKEKIRLRMLSNKINRIRKVEIALDSNAVNRFSFLLNLLRVVFFLVPIAGFGVFTYSINLLQYNATVLQDTHMQFLRFDQINYSVRSQILNNEVGKLGPGDYGCPSNNSCIADVREKALVFVSEFEDNYVRMYRDLDPSFKKIRQYWSEGSIDVLFYTGDHLFPVTERLSFLEILNHFTKSAESVLKSDVKDQMSSNADYLFVTNNGPGVIFDSIIKLEDMILDEEVKIMNEFFIVIGSLMGGLVVSIIWVGLLWVPNYEKVREEVSALGKLREIPRAEVVKMCNLYRVNRENEDDDEFSSFVMSSRVTRRTYTYQRVSILCTILFAMLGFVVVICVGISRAADLSPVANEAALRQSYSASAYYKLRELYLSENVTVAMRDDLAVMRESVMSSNHKLIRASWDKTEEEKWMMEQCSDDLTLGVQRYLVSLMFRTMQDSYRALHLSYEDRIRGAAQNFSYGSFDGFIMECLVGIQQYYNEAGIKTRETTQSRGNIYFWLIWPIFFFTFGYYLPFLFRKSVRDTTARSARILRMIPPAIIESTPHLKDYVIDTGIMKLEKFGDLNFINGNRDGDVDMPSISRRNSREDPRTKSAPLEHQEDLEKSVMDLIGKAVNGLGVISTVVEDPVESEEVKAQPAEPPKKTNANLNQPNDNSSERRSSPPSKPTEAILPIQESAQESPALSQSTRHISEITLSAVVMAEQQPSSVQSQQNEAPPGVPGAVDLENEAPQPPVMGGKCSICHIASAEVQLHPCGHRQFCSSCVSSFTRCPQCMAQIQWRETFDLS
eukprot:TRINITY_DN1372_c0_g1_i1.p1 TRINITY_DN1372_c0_g1~~TRINITY_DN1372_c0_g1_i1.p1  ORF type:complete len:1435 (+),score=316.59 TRINITY_DN1372_c0_g1_i1:64-4368(+)